MAPRHHDLGFIETVPSVDDMGRVRWANMFPADVNIRPGDSVTFTTTITFDAAWGVMIPDTQRVERDY